MNATTEAITHDANGPFLRAYNATPKGQTETVYAIEAAYANRAPDYWNPSTEPHADDDVRDLQRTVYRLARDNGYGAVLSVRRVSRQVTISATEWVEAG